MINVPKANTTKKINLIIVKVAKLKKELKEHILNDDVKLIKSHVDTICLLELKNAILFTELNIKYI